MVLMCGGRHPNEEFDHHQPQDAADVTPPPFSVFNYIDQYPSFFDVVCFRRIQAGGNALQVQERPVKGLQHECRRLAKSLE